MAAMRVTRLLGPTAAAALSALSGARKAGVHTSSARSLRYGWLSYVLGERTTPRFNQKSRIITLDGNLSSGKGAMAQQLADSLGMLHMPEADTCYMDRMTGEKQPLPTDFNGMCSLERFYAEPRAADGNSYRLQLWMYTMRLLQYADAIEHLLTTGQGVVLERSPFSDFVFLDAMFNEGYVRSECVQHYNEIKGISLCEFLPPHMVVYLDLPVKTMGLARLLCGTLECYSKHFRLVNIQQKVFQNASMSTQTSPSVSNVVNRVPGLCSRIFVHTSRGVARRQPAARLCTAAQPSRDVALFEHDRTRFFRLLSVFCGGQFLFWTYLGHFAYTGLRDTGGATEKGKAKASTTTTGLAGMWSFEMNLGSKAWRYGFTLGCLAMGAGIVGLGVLFCRRSVSQVVLHQGGRMVTVSTQSPLGPGRGRRITVPLSQVACHAHRHEAPSFIPLRVKGHKFYFLLDKEGTVNNARLFDITVGAYRQL